MRAGIIVIVVVVTMALPPVSHGFGLMRYVFDAVSNQLGLDRGPIPKVLPNPAQPAPAPGAPPQGRHADTTRYHIQAEGF